MKECKFYKKLSNKRVNCYACAHRCTFEDGKTGICGMRKNIAGKLFLMVYGKIAAENIDSIEKKPLFHLLPASKAYSIGTVGCNFSCSFCQNFDISQKKIALGEDRSPEQIIKAAKENNCKSIAYTYNEPTIWIEFAIDVAKLAKKNKLKNVYVTNGYFTPETLNYLKKNKLVDALNIDLKGTKEFYPKNCGGLFSEVVKTIKLANKLKIWTEVTTLLILGENDKKEQLEEIAKLIASINKNIPWHISRFFPTYKMTNKESTDIQKLKEAYEIGKKYLNYVYVGNLPTETMESTFCPKCKTQLINRFIHPIKNKLKEGKCFNCKQKIAGVWK